MHNVFNELLIAVVFVFGAQNLFKVLKQRPHPITTDFILIKLLPLIALLVQVISLAHYYLKRATWKEVEKQISKSLNDLKEAKQIIFSAVSIIGLILVTAYMENIAQMIRYDKIILLWIVVYIGYLGGDRLVQKHVNLSSFNEANNAAEIIYKADLRIFILSLICFAGMFGFGECRLSNYLLVSQSLGILFSVFIIYRDARSFMLDEPTDWEDFVRSLDSESANLIKEELKTLLNGTKNDSDNFVRKQSEKMERYLVQLASGQITKDKFKGYIRDIKDLTETQALKMTVASKASAQRLANGISDIIIRRLLPLV